MCIRDRYGILRYFNVAGASDTGKIGEIEESHGHLIKNIAVQSLKKRAIVAGSALDEDMFQAIQE